MDHEIQAEFNRIHETLLQIQINGMETKTRVEGMKANIRIGHLVLGAVLAGGGYVYAI